MVKKLGLENRVIFAGLQKDVVPFYCAMDVLLLPSTREAFPMTLVEAQYNGLPCFVSDAVPRETAITDNEFFLPIDKSVDLWISKISALSELGDRTSVFIKSKVFDIQRNYQKLESIYMG